MYKQQTFTRPRGFFMIRTAWHLSRTFVNCNTRRRPPTQKEVAWLCPRACLSCRLWRACAGCGASCCHPKQLTTPLFTVPCAHFQPRFTSQWSSRFATSRQPPPPWLVSTGQVVETCVSWQERRRSDVRHASARIVCQLVSTLTLMPEALALCLRTVAQPSGVPVNLLCSCPSFPE